MAFLLHESTHAIHPVQTFCEDISLYMILEYFANHI